MHAVQASKRMRIRICIDINIFRYEEILAPVSGNTLESSLMRVTRVVQIRLNWTSILFHISRISQFRENVL